jgi:ABC-type glycerol-3-phosphate transport system substrate-binding protein
MWMAGEQGQRLRCGFENKAYLPTWQPILTDDSLFAPQYGFVRNLLSVTKSRPVLPVGAYYWDQLSIAMEEVWTNTKTPAEALKVVETQTQAQLDRFK